MEFERENDVMDQRQDMMDDAIDEATGIEGDEEEGEDIVKEVLDEIGVDLNQSVRIQLRVPLNNSVLTWSTQLGETPTDIQQATASEAKVAQPVGAGGTSGDDDLQARLDSLRR